MDALPSATQMWGGARADHRTGAALWMLGDHTLRGHAPSAALWSPDLSPQGRLLSCGCTSRSSAPPVGATPPAGAAPPARVTPPAEAAPAGPKFKAAMNQVPALPPAEKGLCHHGPCIWGFCFRLTPPHKRPEEHCLFLADPALVEQHMLMWQLGLYVLRYTPQSIALQGRSSSCLSAFA